MEGHSLRSDVAGTVALPSAWTRGLRAVVVVGLLVTALGWIIDPARVWPNVLLAAFYVIGTALAGLAFIAFGYVTRAGWLVAIRRVPEAMASALPVGVACMVVALLGTGVLYEWTHADVVEHDAILQAKSGWLDLGFFIVRALIYFAAWLLFAAVIVNISRRQDTTGEGTDANRVLSAVFLVVFAITFSAATFDWLMSLEPHWFSTVFAIYHFSGLFLAGLATITVLAITLARMGPLRGVLKPDHLHDLGRLTIGFATFWAYIWYCQHMLIWYGNIPEETTYYATRFAGGWGPLSLLNLVVNWLIPFLVLLPRPSKRSATIMFRIALLLLAGRWLDLYVQILPPFLKEGPGFGIWEVVPLAAALSAAVLGIFRGLRRAAIVPGRDPFLQESLHHHT